MLNTWAKINFVKPVNVQQIINQYIWYNDCIQIDKKYVYYKEWDKAGISHMSKLINDQGDYKTRTQISTQFGINIKQMEYNSLIHSFPNSWRKTLKKVGNKVNLEIVTDCKLKIGLKYCNILEITTKDIYLHIMNSNLTYRRMLDLQLLLMQGLKSL